MDSICLKIIQRICMVHQKLLLQHMMIILQVVQLQQQPAGNHYIDPELAVNYVNDNNPNMFGQVFAQSNRYKSTPDNDSNGNQLEFFRDNAAYLSVGMFSNIINGDSHRFNVEYGTAAYDGDKGTNAGDPYGSYWDAGTANREFFPSGKWPANKGLNMTNWIRSLGKFKHWSTADVNHALNSKRGQERYAPFLGKKRSCT